MVGSKTTFLLIFISVFQVSVRAETLAADQKRKQELDRFLKSEKKVYSRNEAQKRSLSSELDRTNLALNHMRNEVARIEGQKAELSASLENLKAESEKEKQRLAQQKAGLASMLRLLYRAHRDGLMEFVFSEKSITSAINRTRLVYRALRESSRSVDQMESYNKHLKESEERLAQNSAELETLLKKSLRQEQDLKKLIAQKKTLLSKIHKRQIVFKRAESEHKEVSVRLTKIFAEIRKKPLEVRQAKPPTSMAEPEVVIVGDLSLPVEYGKLKKSFGADAKNSGGFHKGIEIEAAHGTPVHAVEDGVVEFEGWVRGLGNVIIVHHGDGLYSLSGYLHQVSIAKSAKIKRGEVIGLVGDTGNNEDPALYFELRKENRVIDPVPYFARAKWAQLS